VRVSESSLLTKLMFVYGRTAGTTEHKGPRGHGDEAVMTEEMLFNDMFAHDPLWVYVKVMALSAFVIWAMIVFTSRIHRWFGRASVVTFSAVGFIMLYNYLSVEVRTQDNLTHFSELVGVVSGVVAGIFLQPSWPRRWRRRTQFRAPIVGQDMVGGGRLTERLREKFWGWVAERLLSIGLFW
jgi:hypothetical protein